jgi:hypothetical protein
MCRVRRSLGYDFPGYRLNPVALSNRGIHKKLAIDLLYAFTASVGPTRGVPQGAPLGTRLRPQVGGWEKKKQQAMLRP